MPRRLLGPLLALALPIAAVAVIPVPALADAITVTVSPTYGPVSQKVNVTAKVAINCAQQPPGSDVQFSINWDRFQNVVTTVTAPCSGNATAVSATARFLPPAGQNALGGHTVMVSAISGPAPLGTGFASYVISPPRPAAAATPPARPTPAPAPVHPSPAAAPGAAPACSPSAAGQPGCSSGPCATLTAAFAPPNSDPPHPAAIVGFTAIAGLVVLAAAARRVRRLLAIALAVLAIASCDPVAHQFAEMSLPDVSPGCAGSLATAT